MPQAPSEFGTQPPTVYEREAEIATHHNNPVEHPNYATAAFPKAIFKDDPTGAYDAHTGQTKVIESTVPDQTALDAKIAEGWRTHPLTTAPEPTAGTLPVESTDRAAVVRAKEQV